MKIISVKNLVLSLIFTVAFNGVILFAQKNLNLFHVENAVQKKSLKDYKGALNEVNKSIRLGPSPNLFEYKASYIIRSQIKEELKDYKGAINDLNVFIDYANKINLEKNQLSYWYNERAGLKRLGKDTRGAIKDSNTAIELDPYNEAPYVVRANAKRDLGQIKSACIDYKKAARMVVGTKNGEILSFLAERYCK